MNFYLTFSLTNLGPYTNLFNTPANTTSSGRTHGLSIETHQLFEKKDNSPKKVKLKPPIKIRRQRGVRHSHADRASGKTSEGNITSCPPGILFIFDGPEHSHRIMVVCCLAPIKLN